MKTHAPTFVLAAFSLFSFSAVADDLASGSVSSSVSPAGRTVGIGIELGAPTSLNAKFMVAPNQGVVVGIGGGIWYDASISLHADYLWHPLIADFNSGNFSAYVGGGAWTSLGYGGPHYGYYRPYFEREEAFAVGARLPLGVALAFNEVPVEAFMEIVPSVQLFPGFGAFGQGGIGARFYF